MPIVSDEEFLRNVQDFIDKHDEELGTENTKGFYAEGDYGYIENWANPDEGQKVINHGGLTERPDLQAWIRGRREAFEALLEEYSGKKLALKERALIDQQVAWMQAEGRNPG